MKLDCELDDFARGAIKIYEHYENSAYFLLNWINACQDEWEINLNDVVASIDQARKALKEGKNKFFKILCDANLWEQMSEVDEK